MYPVFSPTDLGACTQENSTLNPNVLSNYRPITVSSTFAKLFEILILPTDTDLCTN